MTDILLFAAGLGTRMGPLVADRPKPLVLVGDTTLIDHALQLTQIPDVSGRVVNVHHKADQLRQHLAAKSVTISDETDLLRDTGGGLRHAFPLLQSDPVLTLNTDAVWSGPNPIQLLLGAWRDDMECLLMLTPRDRVLGHKGKGDFTIEQDGRLTRGYGPVYTGLQLIRRSALDGITGEVFSMNEAWIATEARGTRFGITYPGHWCDVGQPDSIPLAKGLLREDTNV